MSYQFSHMKLVKKAATFLLIAFVVMQFFRPEKNQADVTHASYFETETRPDDEVLIVLKSACYDCHSDNTRYPWYNNIAPVNYWLDDHIRHGKGELNFSDWESYSADKKDHKLEEIIDEVKKGKMPLDEYTWTHADARLSEDQISAVSAWAAKTRALYQLGQRPE